MVKVLVRKLGCVPVWGGGGGGFFGLLAGFFIIAIKRRITGGMVSSRKEFCG